MLSDSWTELPKDPKNLVPPGLETKAVVLNGYAAPSLSAGSEKQNGEAWLPFRCPCAAEIEDCSMMGQES